MFIETKIKQEQVLIIGVQTRAYEDELFQTIMDEMIELTKTAGGKVVGTIIQKRQTPDKRTLIGSGKIEEILAFIEEQDIDLVISMNELSPSTNDNLAKALDVRVIDRVQLILDIFAMRAKTSEGKLQVELAQYQYLLPRIIGKGLALSRLGGGIGTRGPGETKLESDRRYIRERMQEIKKEIQRLEAHRERTRSRRQEGSRFSIGLVGYTNAGKSTLLKGLTDSETYIQDQLFATLDPLTRQFKIDGHDLFTLTDTVGFIEELPTQLIYAFKSTLEEIADVDLLLHVVDASHPAYHLHEETVYELLKELKMDHIPVLTVYNKQDQVTPIFVPLSFPNVLISAYNPEDLERLKQTILSQLIQQADRYQITVPAEDGDRLAWYRRHTVVESLEYDETTNHYLLSGYQRRTDVDDEP